MPTAEEARENRARRRMILDNQRLLRIRRIAILAREAVMKDEIARRL